jgi:hypothetical protein
MKVPTDRVVLLQAMALFAPIHRLRIGIGNSAATVCEVFTATGHLVVKTNTGDFKAPADGEFWPPAPVTMRHLKMLAKMYRTSSDALVIERTRAGLKVGTTLLPLP